MVSNAIQGGSSRVKAIASSSARANQAADAARPIEGRSISNEKTKHLPFGGCNRVGSRRGDIEYSAGGTEKGGRCRLLLRCSNKLDIASTVWRVPYYERLYIPKRYAETLAHLDETTACRYAYVGVTQFNINVREKPNADYAECIALPPVFPK